MTTNEPGFVPDSYTESESKELETLVRAVHEFLCAHGRVKGSTWAFNGWLPDGRAVRHKFKLDGYVRTGPTVDAERKKLDLPTPPTTEEEIARIEVELENRIDEANDYRAPER